MLKSWKFWSVVGTAALLISSVGVSTSWSYLKTLFRLTGQTVRQNIPLDVEIERLATVINDAQKELRQNEQAVARMEVEIEYLQQEVNSTQAQIDRAKAELRKLREYLSQASQSQDGATTIGDKRYTKKDIEADVRRRLQRLEFLEQQLKMKQDTLAKRKQILEQAKDAMNSSHLAIERLRMQQQQLKELKRLQDLQPEDQRFTVDPSKLQEAQQLAQQIEMELKARQKQRDQMLQGGGTIPVELDDRPVEERLREKLGE